jgi:hypothetical protein
VSWASLITAALKLITILADLFRSAKDRKAGRDEVAAKVNRETAEIEHEMAEIGARPRTDADVTDAMQSGRF